MPLEIVSKDVLQAVWNALWQIELTPDVACKEQARDTLFASLSYYITQAIPGHSTDSESKCIEGVKVCGNELWRSYLESMPFLIFSNLFFQELRRSSNCLSRKLKENTKHTPRHLQANNLKIGRQLSSR